MAGISYEGGVPIQNSADSKGPAMRSATLISLRFMIVLAVPYKYGSDEDEKPTLTNLLDAMRQTVIGYKGINTRPWSYVGETPLTTSIENLIMFGQMWKTEIPVVGTTPALT
jgi:hypothetical protein